MIEYKLYDAGLSLKMVSEATGIKQGTLRLRLVKFGALRSRSESQIIAIRTKRHRTPFIKGSKREPCTEEHRQRMRDGKKKWADKHAKGTGISSTGYTTYTMGKNKGRTVHCVMMDKILGRRLFAHECIHHINGIKTDNRVENLQLMTRSEHTSLHCRLRK